VLRLETGCISSTSVNVDCVVMKESVCIGKAVCTCDHASQLDTGKAMDSLGSRHCIISNTMKFINQPVDGDK
jgi:hypothetical protein